MRNGILGLIALAGIAIAALGAGAALADQGSGASATSRNDDFVVICHYDRNLSGPNAGPHTITIDVHALAHHLANHVKKDGFVGDDHIGACTEPTNTPVPPTNTPVPPTNTPVPPTDTPVPPTNTPVPTNTPATVVSTRTSAATTTATP